MRIFAGVSITGEKSALAAPWPPAFSLSRPLKRLSRHSVLGPRWRPSLDGTVVSGPMKVAPAEGYVDEASRSQLRTKIWKCKEKSKHWKVCFLFWLNKRNGYNCKAEQRLLGQAGNQASAGIPIPPSEKNSLGLYNIIQVIATRANGACAIMINKHYLVAMRSHRQEVICAHLSQAARGIVWIRIAEQWCEFASTN